MSEIHTQLVLANIEGFFGVVFFLIAFVGWVINIVSQNQASKDQSQKRPGAQNSAARRARAQREIDQFLQHSRQGEGQGRPAEIDEVEVISPPSASSGRPAPPRRRRTREEIWAEQAAGQSQSAASSSPQRSPRPNEGLAAQHLQSAGGKKNKKAEKRKSVSEQVNLDLPHSVDAHVSSHLPQFTAEASTSTGQQGILSTTMNRKSKASQLGKMLRSKSGVRNAIVLNEILSPPKAFRK